MKLIKFVTSETDTEYYKIELEDRSLLILNNTEYKILKELINRFE